MPPKSAAEILASAKGPLKKPTRKPPTKLSAVFEPLLSTFSAMDATSTSTSSESNRQEEVAEAMLDGMAVDGGVEDLPLQFLPPSTESSFSTRFSDDTDSDEISLSPASEDYRENSESDRITEPALPMTHERRIFEILALLRGGRLSPFDLVLEILDENKPQYSGYQVEFYKESNQKLYSILDRINSNASGKAKLSTWIKGPGLILVCEVIGDKMDDVQQVEKISGGLSSITPEFIRSWSIADYSDLAPATTKILLSAAETSLAHERNTKKSPNAICNVIVKQLSYQRSFHSLGFQALFGLSLWANGCSRQTIEALHYCSISISYSFVLKTITALGNHCMKLAITKSFKLHIFCYDNMNICATIHQEQRGADGPGKVTSGTFGIIYNVRNGVPEHMELTPIMERFRCTTGLKFNRDIRPTSSQFASFHSQLHVIIIRALFTYTKGFEADSYSKDVRLQHKAVHAIPLGYKTEQYPLRVTTIEEASLHGNLLYHDDVYLNMLGHTTESLSKYAIPSSNDQLTNSRIRSCFYAREQDTNAWNRREVFQLGLGLFHLCLNLIWALLHIHNGSIAEPGTLSYFFKLLEKKRLGKANPDYHTLLSALTQILDGLLLNSWRQECGKDNLASFAESKPSTNDLLKIADQILLNYASPNLSDEPPSSTDGNNDLDSGTDSETGEQDEQPAPIAPIFPRTPKDTVYNNVRLLTRDLLYVAELIRAISDGDIGRIKHFLPLLAMMFRGAGSNNYCAEILHFILNLKHVWTPEFANIMRDNQLLNLTGLPGHSMPVDLNIEHTIGELKRLLTAKGLEMTWDHLGDISSAIDYLKGVKNQVSSVMELSHKSKGHSDVDTTNLVWKVANTARDNHLQKFNANRSEN
ncbi:hypothetical protein BJ912DRAFT_927826 [Pholiota molesta]|nr:hypothetical protein BJ912DRAFT_927826 [Pholiota molesta]